MNPIAESYRVGTRMKDTHMGFQACQKNSPPPQGFECLSNSFVFKTTKLQFVMNRRVLDFCHKLREESAQLLGIVLGEDNRNLEN